MQTADYKQADRAQEIADSTIRRFMQLNSARSTFASHWEEVASLVVPEQMNTFQFGNFNTPGEKKTQAQVDATAMLALDRFGAILDSLLTPRNQLWHQLEPSNPYLKKDRNSKLWFESVSRILFKLRYQPIANFSSQNQIVYQSLGAFGTGSMFADKFIGHRGERGLRYSALPLGQTFFTQNHQGLIDGMIRWFRMTPHEAYSQFKEALPEQCLELMKKDSQTPLDFFHSIYLNGEYDPERLDNRSMLWKSCYISLMGKKLLSEGGYNSFPIAASRYTQSAGETYGRGPAMRVLPAIKTLNAEKVTFLKQGHRAADPILLLADDGLMDMSLRPGAMNKGGWSSDGKPLVGVLPTGEIQVTKEMMDEERALINDAFLVTLFQILTETPQMTATEVIERTNEKGILLAPTVGRQQSEYLGPLIDREIDLASELGLLPPMPPLLREAAGEYDVVYTSPLSRAMRAQEASGAMRATEYALTIANATQDPSILDPFDFDVIIPEIASINAVPESWMSSPEAIAAKRQQRQQVQQQQMEIQAAPAAAAMIKAQAVAGKPKG
jgi:hypothetical protein